ncbi:fimbrial protein [Enterobacter sp. SA197]
MHKKSLTGSDLSVAASVMTALPSLSAYSLSKWTFAIFISIMGHHNMKKLLIASSVLAALAMGAAHAGTETTNGGTIEFIGEITDSTCLVSVANTDNASGPARTNNTVILPTVPTSQLAAASDTAGRKGFTLLVGSNPFNSTTCNLGKISERDVNDVPTGNVINITKVRAIFGGPLGAGSINNSVNPTTGYDSAYYNNVNTTSGNLLNIADMVNTGANSTDRTWPATTGANAYPSATNVELQLLDSNLAPIKVGDTASQKASSLFTSFGNTAPAKPSTQVGLQYYVQYIATGTATPGMVRGFVSYDLDYQ